MDIISQSTRCLKGLFTKYLHLSHKEVFIGQMLFLEAVGSHNVSIISYTVFAGTSVLVVI